MTGPWWQGIEAPPSRPVDHVGAVSAHEPQRPVAREVEAARDESDDDFEFPDGWTWADKLVLIALLAWDKLLWTVAGPGWREAVRWDDGL